MALAPSPQPTVVDRLKERLVVALKKNQEKQVFRTRAKLSQVHRLFSGAQDGGPATTCLFSIKKTSVSVHLQVIQVLVEAFFSLWGIMKTKPCHTPYISFQFLTFLFNFQCFTARHQANSPRELGAGILIRGQRAKL